MLQVGMCYTGPNRENSIAAYPAPLTCISGWGWQVSMLGGGLNVTQVCYRFKQGR